MLIHRSGRSNTATVSLWANKGMGRMGDSRDFFEHQEKEAPVTGEGTDAEFGSSRESVYYNQEGTVDLIPT